MASSNKDTIPQPDMKVLYMFSGGVCSLCKKMLAFEKQNNTYYQIGKMAHIQGENIGSARYNDNMSKKERKSYDNLILLCPTCHDIIDADEQQYTVEYLVKIKKEHEEKIQKVYIKSINDLQNVELGSILKYLSSDKFQNNSNYSDYNPIRPDEKINRNNLSESTARYITMGLARFDLVKNYLNKHPDMEFSDNLRSTFVDKYRKLKELETDNDKIFFDLWDFASLNNTDKQYQAAGLTVVTYFFHECEVFEK